MRFIGGLSLALMLSIPAVAVAQNENQYRYDAQGRLVRVTSAISGRTIGYVTTYTYDDADNRTQKNVTFGSFAALTVAPSGTPEIRMADTPPIDQDLASATSQETRTLAADACTTLTPTASDHDC